VLQVEALRDGVTGDLVDSKGRALPPCIVMERGESLQEWANRAEPDLFTSLAVCFLYPLCILPLLVLIETVRHNSA
jgi:hypothetical protein